MKAEEFLEVYKDVVPDYSDHVMQLANGPSVALEVHYQFILFTLYCNNCLNDSTLFLLDSSSRCGVNVSSISRSLGCGYG